MFSYNSHSRKDNLLNALKGLGFEITVIIIICLGVLGILNYFKIISLSSMIPFLSLLPVRDGAKLSSHLSNATFPSAAPTNTFIEKKQGSQPSTAQVVVESQIAEISTKAGTVTTKKGIESYAVKLKVKSGIGEKTFFYEQKDLANITVVKRAEGKEETIGFEGLKIGDKITMDVEYNAVTEDLIKLKIIRN